MPPTDAAVVPISMLWAHILALGFFCSYVGSLYVAKNARVRFSAPDARYRVRPGSRDDPNVIRARLTAVTIACIFTCGVVCTLVAQSTDFKTNHPLAIMLRILGISWPDSILSCLQTPLLFLGPLYASYLASVLPGQANYSLERDFFDVFCTWIGFRNYVWGPFTEEIVFRACVLSVYAMGGAGRGKMIMFAPLVFGLAHVHHAWEAYNQPGRTKAAFQRASISALFQTAYTTLFGAYTSFLFLRTSSLVPPLTAHIFCNIMGIPQMGGEMRRFPAHKKSIIAAYVLGIVLFSGTLMPWTATPGKESLYWRAPAEFRRSMEAYDRPSAGV
ncbi:hypothetical protein DFH07DRAFT_919023 [Mycena maculata]|uniref:intramembrane prenyl-peptidase Rce1 n=1 Tax=Mycena maculata TaxID=230809 RepID=A0AAD7JA58_9AGAR|nr:hypothetical protein DFH07DRAFT_919023 [Mycena maculata]